MIEKAEAIGDSKCPIQNKCATGAHAGGDLTPASVTMYGAFPESDVRLSKNPRLKFSRLARRITVGHRLPVLTRIQA